jgi:hypothetical protein
MFISLNTKGSIFFRDWGKYIILLSKAAAISVHPKPMAEGGRVFGEDGWKSALLQMTSLIIGHNGKNAYNTKILKAMLVFNKKSQRCRIRLFWAL